MKVFEVVAVYDNLSEAYMEPRFFGTLAEAERVFRYQINDIPLWKSNAGDYDLYSLGTFDAETGLLSSNLHKLMNGRSVLERSEKTSDIHPV